MENLANIPRDKDGYLKNLADWTEQLAHALATEESITLTDEHWLVINKAREFYQAYNTSPAIRALVNYLKQEIGPDKGNSIYLQTLFPVSPAKQISKIAGLPKPIRCT